MEPTEFISGAKVEWIRYFDDYPPKDGWQLSYSFRSTEYGFDVIAVNKEDHYLVTLLSAKTVDYPAGLYWWQGVISKGEERYLIGQGSLEIKPNLALLKTYDGRLHVKQVLDALEATLLGKASKDQLSYSISGRSISRLSPSELLKWRDLYRAEYIRALQEQRINQGSAAGNLIKVRFTGT